ncbi:MAG: VOC family protein [Candidatus Eremiobacterota bacterium]
MSELGKIGWLDLTVPEAGKLRDFYTSVVGWSAESIDMGEYPDYAMKSSDGTGVCGVCHARGPNADLPPMWIPYFLVTDLDGAVARLTASGGALIGEVRGMGGADRFCVFRDPAGAVAALYERKK